MKRRDFLKGLSAVALLAPVSALAQTPSPETIMAAKDRISGVLERTLEFESVAPEDAEWIEGFSDGASCTFSDEYNSN